MKPIHIYRIFFPAALLAFSPSGRCQNIPDLSQTAPAGSLAQSYTQPNSFNLGVYHDTNRISIYIPRIAVQDSASVVNLAGADVTGTISYFDNFGNMAQSIIKNYAKTNNAYRDFVQVWDNKAQPDQFAYLPYSVEDGQKFRDQDFYEQKQYYNDQYPGELYTCFSKTSHFSDANTRESRTYREGKSQVGQNRYTSLTAISNDASQVRIWELNAQGVPASNAFYAPNQLFGQRSADPDGNTVLSFKDKSGNLVLKQVQLAASSYLSTYYVYDSLDRLSCILPPKAVAAAASGAVTADVLNNLCFQYQYDYRARMTGERKPGESSFTSYVYDRKKRAVMRQTPLEAAKGDWEVNFYDGQDRVIATSLLHSSQSRQSWQDEFDAYNGASYPTNKIEHYLLETDGEGQYPAGQAITGNTMMSYAYYDNYDLADPSGSLYTQLTNGLAFTETLATPGAEAPERSGYTNGLVTGTLERVLPAPGIDTGDVGDWTRTVTWYDHKGRKDFVLSQSLYKNTAINTQYAGIQYDFSGRVLISKHEIINVHAKGGSNTHTELIKNSYEPVTGRLTETDHSMDGGPWNVLAIYTYDGLGRVSRKNLGDYGEVRDYTYNIRGQLTGINAPYAQTGDNGGLNRSFGESLKYDYGFTTPRYDGALAGFVWRGSGGAQAKALAYGYTYDPAGRLTNADFREGQYQGGLNIPPVAWDKDTMDYTVSHLTYDQDGNILSKDMRGPGFIPANFAPLPQTIDQLTYTYAGNSNRLNAVADKITTNYGDGDFQDGNTTTLDYKYDQDGNLTQDLNKGITSVTYTNFDRPQTIRFANGDNINYSYTADGNKVQELVVNGAVHKTTDYTGNFVYRNDSLYYAATSVGRTVWQNDTAKEEFFVKDHLGNVRSIIDVYHYPLMQYLASYEIASAQLEELFFDDVDGIRDDKPGSTDPGDTKAGRLNGAEPDHRVGTSILLKVMAGDRVQINADNYYDGTYDPGNDRPVSPDDLLNSIVSTLTGGEGGLGESESHDPELVPKLFNPENYTVADELMHAEADPERPKAFLNYILFDQDMRVVRTFTGAWQANGNGGWQTIGNDAPMVIPVNGFLAVYVSNATSFAQCTGCLSSEGDVYFDQLKIQLTKGNLKQESHYYPFGLPMAGIGGSAAGMTPNRQKYQGNEYITDAGLNWMSFGARQYDPQLGRFLSVDPLAAQGGQDMLSPYQAMGDNPANYTDPDGKILIVDPNDQNVINQLNDMLGKDNYFIDDNGVVEISPGQEEMLFNNLVGFFEGGGSVGALGGGDMGGPGTTLAAAYVYAYQIFSAITGADQDDYAIAPYRGQLTYGKVAHFNDLAANDMPDGENNQYGWFARFGDWLNRVFQGHDYGQSPLKHYTDQGGLEAVGKNHGENEETRVTKRDDIQKYDVDWLLDMSEAYTPDLFPNLKLPFFTEYMDNMTDNINAVNAATEINKGSKSNGNHFNFHNNGTSYYGGSYSADPISGDTTGFSKARQHFIDSVRSSFGFPPLDSIY
ncbi:MAG TPA: RHS repeat-associated core domain-containing protein [Edaphocola sp.]|nr:RHS repeat-associated core domain-containing protein [Edaphocola sp.]